MSHKIMLLLICSSLTIAGCQSWPANDIDNLPPTAALPETSVRGEVQIFYWEDISGSSIEALTSNSAFPETPDVTDTLQALSRTSNRGNNYGTLIRGYLYPPASGVYTFYLSGDDETEFWLSSSADPSLITKIAAVPGWTKPLEFNKYASQRSADQDLVAGNRYYFELVQKEDKGGDHFSVAWDGPGFVQQIIADQSIASYAGEALAPSTDTGSVAEAYRLGYSVGFLDGGQNLPFTPDYPPLDSDQDGIYDNWETVYGLDPTNTSDASSDPDSDLLGAADEFLLGTAENNPDSDGDGLPDGVEFALTLNPLDPSDAEMDLDQDGATNIEEYLAGTALNDSTSIPTAPPAPTVYTKGFAGQYFNGVNFDQFLTSLNDPSIQFESVGTGFIPAQSRDQFSSRWFGEFSPPHDSGLRSYKFTLITDDGARLTIDGEEKISAWVDQGPTTYDTTIALEAGQTASLLLEHYEKTGIANAQLSVTDTSTGTEFSISEVVSSPDLSQTSETDTDQDGIPDSWELRYGLSPWADDANEVNNSSGISNIDAFNSSIHPWTLEAVSSPESPTVDDGQVGTEPAGYSVSLSWTPPLTRIDGNSISLSEIQSYEVLYGTSPDSMNESATVDGAETSKTITGLDAGTWYFTISVTDTDGLTSDYSEIVSRTVP